MKVSGYPEIMKRLIHSQLETWFQDPKRKHLVLKGARQVGKTSALHAFGNEFVTKRHQGRYHSLDLKKEKELHSIFQENQDPKKIIELIELQKRIQINPHIDLLLIDEIQDCPHAIST